MMVCMPVVASCALRQPACLYCLCSQPVASPALHAQPACRVPNTLALTSCSPVTNTQHHQMQVNFDAERFVDYITRADTFTRSIRTKLAQAGVSGRPSAAPLPWFDLQGSPLDFDLAKALRGQPVNADTLEQLGQQVGCLLVVSSGSAAVCFVLCCSGVSQRCDVRPQLAFVSPRPRLRFHR